MPRASHALEVNPDSLLKEKAFKDAFQSAHNLGFQQGLEAAESNSQKAERISHHPIKSFWNAIPALSGTLLLFDVLSSMPQAIRATGNKDAEAFMKASQPKVLSVLTLPLLLLWSAGEAVKKVKHLLSKR